jgi:hypothetical protein
VFGSEPSARASRVGFPSHAVELIFCSDAAPVRRQTNRLLRSTAPYRGRARAASYCSDRGGVPPMTA